MGEGLGDGAAVEDGEAEAALLGGHGDGEAAGAGADDGEVEGRVDPGRLGRRVPWRGVVRHSVSWSRRWRSKSPWPTRAKGGKVVRRLLLVRGCGYQRNRDDAAQAGRWIARTNDGPRRS